jgi:hypothetical protein
MLRDEFADGWNEFARNDHDSPTGCSKGRLILSERCVLRLRAVDRGPFGRGLGPSREETSPPLR